MIISHFFRKWRTGKPSVMLLLMALFTFEAEAHKYDKAGIYSNPPGIKQGTVTDTVPASEISKLDANDIQSISTVRDIVTVRLKNGDSVIAKVENYIEPPRRKGSSDDDPLFSKVEVESSYPGGRDGWMHYMAQTFRYPQEAQNKKIQGIVVVRFIVNKEGRVSNIEAIEGPTKGGLREEAIRVIRGSGKWAPALQNGLAVRSYKSQQFISGWNHIRTFRKAASTFLNRAQFA